MPYVVHPRIRKSLRRLAAVTALGALAMAGDLAAGSAAASAASLLPCVPSATSTPFAQFGDQNSYFLVRGGSFEGQWQRGWSLGGAQFTAGNEPFQVNGPTDAQSLTISGGQTVTSPAFCVDASMPYFRFFLTQATAGTGLQVQLVIGGGYFDRNGSATDPIADLADGSTPTWTPTPQLPLSSALVIPSGGSVEVQIRITAPHSSGSWQIDDVFVDPYRVA
jgi:hypothetical protein